MKIQDAKSKIFVKKKLFISISFIELDANPTIMNYFSINNYVPHNQKKNRTQIKWLRVKLYKYISYFGKIQKKVLYSTLETTFSLAIT